MSRRVSSSKASGCKHCQNMGENSQLWSSHNTLDVNGRVCCPKILANVCSKCNVRGHLPSRCQGKKPAQNIVCRVSFREPVSVVEPKALKPSSGRFDSFMDDDSSLDQSPRSPVKIKPLAKDAPWAPTKALVTVKTESGLKPISWGSARQMDWAVKSDDEDLPFVLSKNVTVRSKVKRNWADYESDEDEDW